MPALVAADCAGIGPADAERDPGFNLPIEPTPVMAGDPAVLQRGTVFHEIPGRTGSHAPSIAVLADGTLLAAWYSYRGPGELDGAALYLARRGTSAPAWEEPILHADGPPARGNPVLFAEGGTVWLFCAVVAGTGWSTAHVEMQQSADGGLTWSRPAAVAPTLGLNVRSPPIRLAGGDLLLPAYDDLLSRSVFCRSVDGRRWSRWSTLAGSPGAAALQPAVFEAADGRLVAVFRNAGGGWLWSASSGDGGRSWAGAYDSGLPNPGSPAAMLRLRGLASAGTPQGGGTVVLVYNDSATERRPLSIAASADEGRTWLPPRVLVDGPGEYAYPSICESAPGRLEVLYSDDRQRIGHVTVTTAWIVGREG